MHDRVELRQAAFRTMLLGERRQGADTHPGVATRRLGRHAATLAVTGQHVDVRVELLRELAVERGWPEPRADARSEPSQPCERRHRRAP